VSKVNTEWLQGARSRKVPVEEKDVTTIVGIEELAKPGALFVVKYSMAAHNAVRESRCSTPSRALPLSLACAVACLCGDYPPHAHIFCDLVCLTMLAGNGH
jgi:hypothetical protein